MPNNPTSSEKKPADRRIRRYSIEDVRQILSQQGLELLTPEYTSNKSPLPVRCSKDHEFSTTLVRAARGHGCPECAGNRRFSIEEVRKFLRSFGYELLSGTYLNNSQPLSIFCDRGHTYTATFHNFRAGHRCTFCNGSNLAADFGIVKEAMQNLGYRWISGEYSNNRSPMVVACANNHEFETFWAKLQRHGCPHCKKGVKIPYAEVSARTQLLGFRLLTPESDYLNRRQKLEWYCKSGHHFTMTLRNLLRGGQCPICADRYWTLGEVKAIAERRGYRVLDSDWVGVNHKLDLVCPQHHEFRMSFFEFNRGRNCRDCQRYSLEEIQKAFEVKGYRVLSTEYLNSKTPVEVQCAKGHTWNVIWNSFQSGANCPSCQVNRPEQELQDFLAQVGVEVQSRNRVVLNGKELDLYCPENKLAIEHCGLYFHSSTVLGLRDPHPTTYHQRKMRLCRERGIRLFTVFGDEWLVQRELVESKIRHALGKSRHKFYPREGTVKLIEDRVPVREFLEYNHLQGFVGFKMAWGFFVEDQLLAVITLGRPSRAHVAGEGAWEIKRMAIQRDYHLPGVFKRILHHAIPKLQELGVRELISFCDLRWSEGKVYRDLGWELVSESAPSPHVTDTHRRWSIQGFQSKKGSTKKFLTIWDCGHQKWRLRIASQY